MNIYIYNICIYAQYIEIYYLMQNTYQRLLPEPRISSSGDSQKPAAASWKLPQLPLLNMATWEIL